jgi:hypothetical protein
MAAFTKDEQWDHNYEIFLVDKDGRLGRFDHVGWRLLPPTIAKSKEDWERVVAYFDSLETEAENYNICPDLLKHLDINNVVNFDEYVKVYGEISSKGLYSYDSYGDSFKERPYFRVTFPKSELFLEDLPKEIGNILEDLKMFEVSFADKSLISEEIVRKL